MKFDSKKWDLLIAFLLSAAVFLVAFRFCDNTHPQGDDFAAYILQAKAMAEGTVGRQLRLNAYMHPSVIFDPAAARADTLTYVWGYPLMLLPIYLRFGFDPGAPMGIFLYKLPGIICYGLFAGVLYLFYRRRFGRSLSGVLCLCMVFSIVEDVNIIQTDFPFLLFSMLSFLLAEVFFARPRLLSGLALGLTMAAAVLTRLNGFTVSLLILLQQLVFFVSAALAPGAGPGAGRRPWRRAQALAPGAGPEAYGPGPALALMPHALLLLLTAFTFLLLGVPTSNLSDVGLGNIQAGFAYYISLMRGWCVALTSYSFAAHQRVLLALAVGLFALGLVTRFRQELGYALFIFGTVLVNIRLPYHQGLRYYYNILPLILLFMAHGGDFLYRHIRDAFQSRLYRRFVTVLAAVVLVGFSMIRLLSVRSTVSYLRWENSENASLAVKNLYSESCMEAYDFLTSQTDAQAVIAFRKPRALYLNTGRVSFRPGVNGHTLEEADYYMEFTQYHGEELDAAAYDALTPVFDNGQIRVYRCP